MFLGVCKKVPENTRKSRKIPKIGLFRAFFDFFGYFRGLFLQTPKKTLFETFWGFRARRPATEPGKPPNPENTKKNTNPPPPEIQKKYRKNIKTAQKLPVPGRFRIFSVFSGVNPGWGILYFFRIFGLWGSSGSVAVPQDRNARLAILEIPVVTMPQTVNHPAAMFLRVPPILC